MQNVQRILIAAVITISVLTTTAQSEANDANEAALALPSALLQHMTNAYLCQDSTGGDAFYQVAKLHTKEVLSAVMGANETVLKLHAFEEKLKKDYPNPGVTMRAKMGNIARVDIDKACVDILNASHDKIEVLEAKLGMLK
jgi:hypothetical protein